MANVGSLLRRSRPHVHALAVYAGSYGLIKVLGAGGAALSAVLSFAVAGAEAFGVFAAIVATCAIAGGAASGWVGQSIIRFGGGAKTGWWRLLLFSRQGLASLVGGSAFAACVSVFVALAVDEASAFEVVAVGCMGVVATIALAAIGLEIAKRQAALQPGAAGVLEVSRAIGLTLPPAVVARVASDLAGTILALAVLVCFVAMALAVTIRYSRGSGRAQGEFDAEVVRRYWAYGFPLALWMLLAGLYQFSDRVMLTRLASPTAAGEYALIYDVLNRGLVFPLVAVGTATNPLVFRRYESARVTAARRLNRLTVRVQVLLGLALAVPGGIGLFYISPRVAWWGSDDTIVAVLVYGAGVLWAVAAAIQRTEMGKGLTKPLLWRLVGTAGLNVALNGWLIPPLGGVGAAIATLSSAVVYVAAVSSMRSADDGMPMGV